MILINFEIHQVGLGFPSMRNFLVYVEYGIQIHGYAYAEVWAGVCVFHNCCVLSALVVSESMQVIHACMCIKFCQRVCMRTCDILHGSSQASFWLFNEIFCYACGTEVLFSLRFLRLSLKNSKCSYMTKMPRGWNKLE